MISRKKLEFQTIFAADKRDLKPYSALLISRLKSPKQPPLKKIHLSMEKNNLFS